MYHLDCGVLGYQRFGAFLASALIRASCESCLVQDPSLLISPAHLRLHEPHPRLEELIASMFSVE